MARAPRLCKLSGSGHSDQYSWPGLKVDTCRHGLNAARGTALLLPAATQQLWRAELVGFYLR